MSKKIAEIIQKIYLQGKDDQESRSSNLATVIPENIKAISDVYAEEREGFISGLKIGLGVQKDQHPDDVRLWNWCTVMLNKIEAFEKI